MKIYRYVHKTQTSQPVIIALTVPMDYADNMRLEIGDSVTIERKPDGIVIIVKREE